MTQSAAAPRVYPVGAVVAGVRRLLEERVGRLWVVGEVSNFRRPGSGHCYFTLKDGDGQLRAALFRSQAARLAFEPEDGMEVLAYGDLTVYEARGEMQLVVRQLEPRGVGALQLAFEQLKAKLSAEGLFDADRKRELPALPRRVGVVTSSSGAALRDVLEVSRRRFPSLPLRLATCRVQGVGAETEVAGALNALARDGDCDAILLVRGGGSLEDLQPFNTETLARAIADCAVPVVSGVGHETDLTIADWVSDARAPTPSAAAELAIPDRRSLAAQVARQRQRLGMALRSELAHAESRWQTLARALQAQAPHQRVSSGRERWSTLARDLQRALDAHVERARAALGEGAARLEALSPLAVLGRGYGLVRRESDAGIVRSAADAPPGERLDVRVARARLVARVESSRDDPGSPTEEP
ncbi:MAG: exodeoxyribonuclease VII large subunit [Myxococcota bacterium]